MSVKKDKKKWSKMRIAKVVIGGVCAVTAIAIAGGIMGNSYTSWKKYYDTLVAEKEHKKYLESLPLTLDSISAELDDGIVYYDNDTADPIDTDFVVLANFSEKGREFSKKLSAGDYTFEVPEDFAQNGGTITFSYTWQPAKAEDASEDDPLPDPVTKTTELNITLAQPDETVFKIVRAPTFTETGIAENIAGTQKVLPILNDVNYQYTENVSSHVARFVYPELNITISKPLVADIKIKVPNAGIAEAFNNVNCHFYANYENATISFDDETNSFVVKAEGGKTAELGAITTDESVTFAGSGTTLLNSTLKVGQVIVKAGANLRIQDVGTALNVSSIYFEPDSNVTLLTVENSIVLKGSAKLFGNLHVEDQAGKNTKTGITYQGAEFGVIEFSATSRVTFKHFTYSIGKFGDYASPKVLFPVGTNKVANGSLAADEKAAWYVDTVTGNPRILSLVDVVYAGFANCTQEIKSYDGEYTVVKVPTETDTGLATAEGKEDVVLPVLNKNDYAIKDNGTEVTFTHFETGIAFTVAAEGARITINGVTYNPFTLSLFFTMPENLEITRTDDVYTVTVADGKTVELNGLSADRLVIAGGGTLILHSTVTAKSFTVKSGMTLRIQDVTNAISTASLVLEEGTDVTCLTSENAIILTESAKLYGKLHVEDQAGNRTKTGIYVFSATVPIELSDTSEITFKSFTYAIGKFGTTGGITLQLPLGTKQTASGDLEPNEKAGWYVLRGGEKRKILTLIDCQYANFANTTTVIESYEGDYTLVTKPTTTTAGLATADGLPDITLPVLNKNDYSFSDVAEKNEVTFIHDATGISFNVAAEGKRLSVNGVTHNPLTVSIYLASEDIAITCEAGVYTIAVADGKTVEWHALSGDDFVIAGEGTFKLRSQLTAKSLTVKSGATLYIESSGIGLQATTLDFEAGSDVTVFSTENDAVVVNASAKFFGKLHIKDLAPPATKKTGVKANTTTVTIELSATSRITIEDFMYAFARYGGGSITVNLPEGAEKTANGDLQGERASWYVLNGEVREKILTIYNSAIGLNCVGIS